MDSTFEHGRVVVRTGLVEVDGKPFPVAPGTRVEAIVDPPRFKVWLVLLGLSLLGVPAAVIAGSLAPGDQSWWVALPMAVAMVSLVRFLTATTRYHVALVADRDARFVYSSDDLQTVVFLVAMVRDAVPARR